MQYPSIASFVSLMTLTLSTFRKELPKDLLKTAGRLTVRECDETGEGMFEGYVDEGRESYDVRIGLEQGSRLTKHHCDCGAGANFCRHRAALLLHLESGSKIKAIVAPRKKRSATEELLDEADPQALKAWIAEQLGQSPDLQLAFMSRFGRHRVAVSIENTRQYTIDAVKAVVGRKQAIDAHQLKRILQLWEGLHEAALDHYRNQVTQGEAFEIFQALLDTVLAFGPWLTTQSPKLIDYATKLLQSVVAPINDLQQEESWERAVAPYLEHLFSAYQPRYHYLHFLHLMADVSSGPRREALANGLMRAYLSVKGPDLRRTEAVLRFLEDTGTVRPHIEQFPAYDWEHEYNQRLLGHLLDAGAWERAGEVCEEQLEANTSSRFDLPYLQVLKRVYQELDDTDSLRHLLDRLILHHWDIDDLQLLLRLMPEDEGERYRKRLLLQARNQHGDVRAAVFAFALLASEQAWDRMVAGIDGTTPIAVLAPYLDELYRADARGLLTNTLAREDRFGFIYPDNEEEFMAKEDLAAWFIRRYPHPDLRKAVLDQQSRRRGFRGNTMLRLLGEALEGSDF